MILITKRNLTDVSRKKIFERNVHASLVSTVGADKCCASLMVFSPIENSIFQLCSVTVSIYFKNFNKSTQFPHKEMQFK